MVLAVLLAIIAIVLLGVGFVFKWLFIAAAVAAVLFVISLLMGGTFGRRRATY